MRTPRIAGISLALAALVAASACGATSPSAPSARMPVELPPPDVSCRVSSDCVVKDVGNCCGYYPMCVNAGFPADPDAVMRFCAEHQLASPCSFVAITRCECAQGSCIGL